MLYSYFLQLEACIHPFFYELRDPNARLPNGRPFPPLFNFKPQGLLFSIILFFFFWVTVSKELVTDCKPIRLLMRCTCRAERGKQGALIKTDSRTCTKAMSLPWFLDFNMCCWILE